MRRSLRLALHWFSLKGSHLPAIAASVVSGAAVVVASVFLFIAYCGGAHGQRLVCSMLREDPPWSSLTAIAAVPLALLAWYWRILFRRQELESANDERGSSRLAKAIELLANDSVIVRVGAIKLLVTAALDNHRVSAAVIELLATFVRARATKREQVAPEPAPEDVSAAVAAIATVTGNRARLLEPPSPVDLSGLNLAAIRVPPGGSLEYANLSKTLLSGALLSEVDLSNAVLSEAGLSGANLQAATLRYAALTEANLTNADLSQTALVGADLSGAVLDGAKLAKADISRANFSRVSMHWQGLADCVFVAPPLLPPGVKLLELSKGSGAHAD